METFFNLEQIHILLQHLSNLTGLVFTFCDETFNHLVSHEGTSDFCSYVREKGRILCQECDMRHLLQVKQQTTPLTYTCHAGIIETIIPITHFCRPTVYILAGQYCDKEEHYSSKEKMIAATKKLGLPKNKIINSYQALPCLTQKQISAIISLISTLSPNLLFNEPIQDKENLLASKISSYIQNHLDEDISVELLCKEFFISRNTLYKVINKSFNTSVLHLVLRARLDYAKKLLQLSSMSITEISNKCGFRDYNYFIRCFKKYIGSSPLQYRNMFIQF